MRVRTILAALAATQLSGCFFVFIPGSLIQKASDSITGAEGDHCVHSGAKVGDKLTAPDGRVGEVKSLSGTSVRCGDANKPIRARIEFS